MSQRERCFKNCYFGKYAELKSSPCNTCDFKGYVHINDLLEVKKQLEVLHKLLERHPITEKPKHEEIIVAVDEDGVYWWVHWDATDQCFYSPETHHDMGILVGWYEIPWRRE